MMFIAQPPIPTSCHHFVSQKLNMIFSTNVFEPMKSIYLGVSSTAQDSLAQDLVTSDLYFYTRDFSRIFLRKWIKYETVSSSMYISRVNCVFWLLVLFNA